MSGPSKVAVYVRLLDEGTLVPAGSDSGARPELEIWELAPGDVVRCARRIFSAGEGLAAVELLARA